MRARVVFALVLAGSAVGCSDPIIGEWEAEIDNVEYEVKFEKEGLGAAEAVPQGVSGKLYFDVTWEAAGDRYQVELDCVRSTIDGLSCDTFAATTDYDCEIDSGGDLSCEPDDCSDCAKADFKKQE